MTFLITSGGTAIPLDLVRSIRNMSTGTFGAKIATEALRLGHKVVFLKAKGSKSPFSQPLDFRYFSDMQRATELRKLFNEYGTNYEEIEYTSFDDYAEMLPKLLAQYNPDITILAAAVSDYKAKNVVNGKIRTKGDLTIELEPLPKLISKVKEWNDHTLLVGFKLLVNSTDDELIDEAKKSICKNGCDLVVANDLRDIKQNDHRLHLVTPKEDDFNVLLLTHDKNDPNFLARAVVAQATVMFSTRQS